MKKAIIIIGILLAILLCAVIAIPIIFKKPLLEKTKTTINNQINAKVDFSDFKLSLIRNFPKVTLELTNVSVLGTEAFSGDTLMAIPSFRTRISLASLFSDSELALEELILKSPYLNLKVDSLGNANWDIIKESETVSETQSASNTFQIELNKIIISDATIVYDDIAMPMFLSFKESEINLKGKMFGSETELWGEATVGKFLLNYDSVTYISNSTLKTTTVFNIDFDNWIFDIKESECWINQLPFELSGDFRMPNDSMFFNLDFKAKRTGLGDFLALTPPDYEIYMKDVKTEGNADFKGYFRGLMFDEDYPSFSFDFNINNGKINYTNLPEEIRNISADVQIWKPQGSLDLMGLSIKNTKAEIAGNPVELSASVSNIYTDMNFEFGVKGKINFTKLKNSIPIENMSLDGIVDANIFAKGKYSDVELKKYENIQTDGSIVINDVIYSSPAFIQSIKIPTGNLNFSPAQIDLTNFRIITGNSDLEIAGKVSNYLSYFLYNGVLGGDIKINSNTIDINELMAMMPVDSTTQKLPVDSLSTASKQTDFSAFTIPANYDFKLSASVSKSKYELLPLSNIKLAASVKNGSVTVENFSAMAAGSEIKMNAFYGKQNSKNQVFSVNGTLRSFDIPTFYNALPSLKEMVPEAANAVGKADAQIKAEGEIASEFKMNLLEGSATLSDFKYTDATLTQPVIIQKGKLDFTLQEINLSQLNITIGKSDMSLSGKVLNFIDYYNSKGILDGSIQLKSNYLDINELMNLQVAENKNTTNQELKAFQIPANLNLNFSTNITKALYEKITIESIEGLATVGNGKLNLDGLVMKMLNGELKLNGSYAGNEQNQPDVDFGIAIQDFDFPSSFNMLKFFQDKIPISKNAQGKFSTSFSMKGKLSSDMKIEYPTINGNGLIKTTNFQLIESTVFDQLSSVFKKEKLKNVKLDDFTGQFTIENGSIALKPFQTKIAGQEVKMSGNINAQNLVNLKMDFTIQRDAFGPEIQKLLSVLPGQERIQLLPASVTINGPVKQPSVGINLDEAKKLIADEAKKSATDELKNQINKIGNLIKKQENQ